MKNKVRDITNERFGKLIAINFVYKESKYMPMWLCHCDCGNKEFITRLYSLVSKKVTSCGCVKKAQKIKIIEPRKINRWTIFGDTFQKHNNTYVKAFCECSPDIIHEIYLQSILKGQTKSCGCYQKDSFEDFVGKKFNKLIVLAKSCSPAKNGESRWVCRCDCGKMLEKPVAGGALKNGHTKSCGCILFSDEVKQKRKNTNIIKFGVDNPLKNPDIAMKQVLSSKKVSMIRYWKTDEFIPCQGGYEVAVANYLNSKQISFEWQNKISRYSNQGIFEIPSDVLHIGGRTYRMDFYLVDEDIFIQVKGRNFDKNGISLDKLKWEWFHEKYPNSELWDAKKLKELGIHPRYKRKTCP